MNWCEFNESPVCHDDENYESINGWSYVLVVPREVNNWFILKMIVVEGIISSIITGIFTTIIFSDVFETLIVGYEDSTDTSPVVGQNMIFITKLDFAGTTEVYARPVVVQRSDWRMYGGGNSYNDGTKCISLSVSKIHEISKLVGERETSIIFSYLMCEFEIVNNNSTMVSRIWKILYRAIIYGHNIR